MNRIGNLLSFFEPGYYLDPLLESLLTPIAVPNRQAVKLRRA